MTGPGKRILMDRLKAGPDEVPLDDWQPPRKHLLRKIGLTVLMVALGVAPALALMASDPLGNLTPEVAAENASREASSGSDETAPPFSEDEVPAVTPMPSPDPRVFPHRIHQRDGWPESEPEKAVDNGKPGKGANVHEKGDAHPDAVEDAERHCLLICLGPG